jgi:hypothetical protein
VVLRPAADSFYSVDVLNPDVVHTGNKFRLFFSGNSAHTPGGDWRTGVAVSRHPTGPFTVDSRLHEPFLNGSTIMVGGRFLHAATVPGLRSLVLFESRNAESWQQISAMPDPAGPSWRFLASDAYLRRTPTSVAAYFAAREGATGAQIGSVRFRDGRWSQFAHVLARFPGDWDGLDLGEPAVFRARGRTFMLYGGLGGHGEPRHIGLARLTGHGWRRCGTRPFISAGAAWYRQNAIDPEPQVVGNRLYVYFGGGNVPSLGGDMKGTIGLRVYRLPERP